jgi:hypothetical protein
MSVAAASRLMSAWNVCYVPGGSSASVTLRASSPYTNFPFEEITSTFPSYIDVILGVATKVMSNYTKHIVHTQYDMFMKGNDWTKPVTTAA